MNWKEKKIKWTRKQCLIALGCFGIVLLLTVLVVWHNSSKAEYVYKETAVMYGKLTVGVTQSGTVDIGTVEQTFDLDMSALQRVETGSTGGSTNAQGSGGSMGGSMGGGMPGGMSATGGTSFDLFSQMLGGGSSVVSGGNASTLTIADVLVSVGQQVSEGDPLFALEKESVSELEQELKDNVDKAKADLEAVYADQKLTSLTAQNTYDIAVAYGSYAQTEYNASVQSLYDTLESAEATLEKAKTTLAEYESRLADMTESYSDAAQAVSNLTYSLNHTDTSDVYSYVYYFQLKEQAEQSADSLEQQMEQLEKNVEQAKQSLETAEKNYTKAKRGLEQGLLSAKQTLALRKLAYETAQETYDITVAYLEEDAKTQEEIYQETQKNWDTFSSYISGNYILAGYHGVITSVELEAGDSISTGSALVTLYDLEDVSMTVSVYESDMTDISLGSAANISFTAYPDEQFMATVTEISDASTNTSGNVYYEVTVTIDGDASGLFQGMTGEITFITQQSEEALYVSKRAIITENDKTYVKVKEENGNITKKKVTTGFSDGTYVQITEGLVEGDIVLIESKVSGS